MSIYQRLSSRDKLQSTFASSAGLDISAGTRRIPFSGIPRAWGIESDTAMELSRACKISNLIAYLTDAAAGAGNTFIITLYRNGAPQTLTVTIGGAADRVGEDNTNVVQLARGDLIYWYIQVTGAPAANGVTISATLRFN